MLSTRKHTADSAGRLTVEERLQISRREIDRVLDQLRRGIEASQHPILSPRKEAILKAAATCIVLRHPRPWASPVELRPFWTAGRLPTPAMMRSCAGPAKDMVTHLDMDDAVRPWTGGFWAGLRMSGALVVHGGYPRVLGGRPWLEQDLEHLPFPGQLSPPDRKHRRWLVRCHAWRLPVRDRYAPDLLAGLLAGARREDQEDGMWLLLPRTKDVMQILAWWRLSVMPGDTDRKVMVSPFYGSLLESHMPPAAGRSMTVMKAGACPLLSLAVYNVIWGPGRRRENYLMPPRAGLLPYLPSHATRSRNGWDREFLYQASVKLGVAHVPIEQRELLESWRAQNRHQEVATPSTST